MKKPILTMIICWLIHAGAIWAGVFNSNFALGMLAGAAGFIAIFAPIGWWLTRRHERNINKLQRDFWEEQKFLADD